MITAVNSSPVMGSKKIDFNSKKNFKTYSNLAPRNIYLQEGRIMCVKEANKIIENFAEPFWVRAKNWVKYKFEDIFG